MEFLVRYNDGDERWITWTNDLFNTVQYEEYCRSVPSLWQMIYQLKVAARMAADLNKVPITEVAPNDTAYVDIRWFGAEWYRQASLPEDKYRRTFVVLFIYRELRARGRKITASCPVTGDVFPDLDHVFVKEYGHVLVFDPLNHDIG